MINALAEAVKNIKNAAEKQLNKKEQNQNFANENFPIHKKDKKNTVYILNRVLFVYSDKLFLFLSFSYSDKLFLFFFISEYIPTI